MSCASGPEIVNDGLVLHLDAANTRSYAGTGSTWKDLIAINDTVLSSCGFEGISKGGITMPTGSQYLTIPINNFAWMGTGDFTIETVVRSDDAVYPRSRHPFKVFNTVSSASTPGWSCGHSNSETSTEIMCADGVNHSRILVTHPLIQQSTYYHRAFTISRATGLLTKYYINGELVGQADATTVTGSIYNPTSDYGGAGLTFGYVWGWRFIGSVNTVKVYNKVLTASEIKQNFNALRSRFNL